LTSCASPALEVPVGLRDTGVGYRDRDEAAKAACKLIWDQIPRAKRYEYCGILFSHGEGEIRISVPKTDNKESGCTPPVPPSDLILLGRYHNHRLTPEPSPPDRRIAERYPQLGHYVCAPSGIVRRFSLQEGTVIVR